MRALSIHRCLQASGLVLRRMSYQCGTEGYEHVPKRHPPQVAVPLAERLKESATVRRNWPYALQLASRCFNEASEMVIAG